MREKNLVILCIIFAVLIGVAVIKKSTVREPVATQETSDIITAPLDLDQITEIVIRLGNGQSDDPEQPKSIDLAKSGDHWEVKTEYGVYARDQVIKTLVEKLDSLEGELRSDKKGILGDYGIDDNEAVHVQIYRGGSDYLELAVGVIKAGNQNNFVRLQDSNVVYAVSENLLNIVGYRENNDEKRLDTQKWSDKRITHIKSGEVNGIRFTEPVAGVETAAVDLKKETADDKTQWKSTVPYDFSLSASKIKTVAEVFNSAYAQDILAPDVEGVFDRPGWTGVFTYEDGSELKLVRGDKDPDGKYYVKIDGAPYIFQVAESTFNAKKNQLGRIFANNPLKVNGATMTEIEINDLVNNKKYHAVKKTREVAEEPKEGEEAAEPKKEDYWEGPDGAEIEKAKANNVISKAQAIAVEAEFEPDISTENAVILRIVSDGTAVEYVIKKPVKLDTGKECQFLSLKGSPQSYCATKSSVEALQNILP